MDSKKYNNIKLAVGISEGILSFVLILLFVSTGLSSNLQKFLGAFFQNDYLLFFSYTIVVGTAGGILFFPFSFYTGYYLEHKYNLSNQSFFKWMWENFKGLLVSAVIVIPILLFFFYFIFHISVHDNRGKINCKLNLL